MIRDMDTMRRDGMLRRILISRAGEEWICSEHGAMCILGICKARASPERNRRREEEHKERPNAKKKEKERR